MAQIRSKPFGVTKEGANVTEYTLSNPGGLSVSVLDYGCVIKNIIVPAKNGPGGCGDRPRHHGRLRGGLPVPFQHLLRCVRGALRQPH